MQKNNYYLVLILKILITASAYFYIYFRIKNSFAPNSRFELINFFNFKQKYLLIITVFLMLINWFLESIKWQKLTSNFEKLSLNKSIKSVLIGVTCSIITPYRLGDYIGRLMKINWNNRTQAVIANFIGSISQNIATFGIGVFGFILMLSHNNLKLLESTSKYSLLAILFLLSLCLIYFYLKPEIIIIILRKIRFTKNIADKLVFLQKITKKKLVLILILSLARYFIFSLQYYLLLIFCNINISPTAAFIAISLSYVFLFSIPGIPIADIGIRGSLALFFIGMHSSNEIGIILASVLLWIINLAVPALMGSVFLIRTK